ncbi:MAG: Cap15 family cyclic dinucleotide receptor domain-containing protein [Acidimicrobiales bacterium]
MGLTIVLLGAYDRWLWKLGPLRKLQKQPVLHGVWKGSLQTAWCNPETGEVPGPIEVYLVVRQTCSSIAFSMCTSESRSQTVSAALEDSESGAWVMSGTYLNTPQLLHQDRSRVHRGSAVLEVHRGTNVIVEGSYWTDRDSKGSIRFTEHVESLPTHFEHAQAVFS